MYDSTMPPPPEPPRPPTAPPPPGPEPTTASEPLVPERMRRQVNELLDVIDELGDRIAVGLGLRPRRDQP